MLNLRRNLLRSAVSVTILAASGCADFGVGGTNERVVAIDRLRRIEPVHFQPATSAASTQPTTQPAQLRLALSQVRQIALNNNLELRAELLGPSIASESVSIEQARFEALFTLSADFAKLDSPTASQLSGSQVDQYNLRPGLTIPLQTGGSIRVAAPISRLSTNNQFSTLDPSFETDLSVAITQPLFRGAGTDANAERIRVAFYRYQQAETRARLNVIRILADADRSYWRLVAARQQLELRRQELELAEAQLERARRQVNVGAAAEVEVTRAESGVADRVESVIVARNNVRDRERELKRLLNMPDVPLASSTEIEPLTQPEPVLYDFDPNALLTAAVTNRMELLELELQIAEQTATVLAARNATLPIVSLEYQYNINGLGGSFNDSVSLASDLDYQDHRLGLTVEIPLGNAAARARLRQSLLSRIQTLATRDSREEQIRVETLSAIDRVNTNWQRILAARQRVILAARVVELESRQFEQGLRTSTDVLDAQTRLADARSSEIGALADYQIAQIDLAYATGTLLGAAAIDWAPLDGRSPSDERTKAR